VRQHLLVQGLNLSNTRHETHTELPQCLPPITGYQGFRILLYVFHTELRGDFYPLKTGLSLWTAGFEYSMKPRGVLPQTNILVFLKHRLQPSHGQQRTGFLCGILERLPESTNDGVNFGLLAHTPIMTLKPLRSALGREWIESLPVRLISG